MGYPLLLAYALRVVTASHAAVITALLPLVSAVVAAWVLHQRARLGFWVCAVIGSLLVLVFSVLRAQQHSGGFGFEWADLLLVGAVIAASFGYIFGAKVTPALGAERVICWVCVMALPVTLPATLVLWPSQPIATLAAYGGRRRRGGIQFAHSAADSVRGPQAASAPASPLPGPVAPKPQASNPRHAPRRQCAHVWRWMASSPSQSP